MYNSIIDVPQKEFFRAIALFKYLIEIMFYFRDLYSSFDQNISVRV